jgi:hypothetical protein
MPMVTKCKVRKMGVGSAVRAIFDCRRVFDESRGFYSHSAKNRVELGLIGYSCHIKGITMKPPAYRHKTCVVLCCGADTAGTVTALQPLRVVSSVRFSK